MQVTQIMSSLGMVRGGLETIATQFAVGLAERGVQITIVSGARPDRSLPVRWIRVPCLALTSPVWRVLPQRAGWPLQAQSLSFMAGCRFHAGARRALVDADVTLAFFEIEAAQVAALRRRASIFYFAGGMDWKWLRRDRSTLRVATSRTIADRYHATFPIASVITPGVSARLLDQSYQVRSPVQRLIFVGRLEANKGELELLAVFAVLAREFPDVHLCLIGDGPLRARLQQTIAQRQLDDRVHLLGALSADDVAEQLRQSDVFVFPSRYESFGIAVLEAQAAGVPVVCSDLPALREATGEIAQLLPCDDQARWIAALRRLIGDRAERERLSSAGRRHARGFTWEQKVDALERCLHQALSPQA